jgi:hypothetical protein
MTRHDDGNNMTDDPLAPLSLSPGDFQRIARLVRGVVVDDGETVGQVIVELRTDPRGADASITLATALAVLLVTEWRQRIAPETLIELAQGDS